MAYGLRGKDLPLRLQREGTPGSWGSVDKSMAEAPPALPWGWSVPFRGLPLWGS